VGRAILVRLMDSARARGDREIVLHAQRSAQAFYAKMGFLIVGAPFQEVGIPHVTMSGLLGQAPTPLQLSSACD